MDYLDTIVNIISFNIINAPLNTLILLMSKIPTSKTTVEITYVEEILVEDTYALEIFWPFDIFTVA